MSKRASERAEFLADIIIVAVEGGINYWALVSAYHHSDGPENTYAVLHPIKDDETGYMNTGLQLDIDVVARGIGRVKQGDLHLDDDSIECIIRASKANDSGEIDSDLADAIVQAALLGDVIYG